MQTTVCDAREEIVQMELRCSKSLSPSSIDLWRRCPRRFAYSQGLIKADATSIAASKEQSYEQLLGNTVHKALESLLKAAPQLRTAEAIQRTIDWTARRFSNKAASPERTLERLLAEATPLISDYLSGDGAAATPVAVERPFSLSLTDGTIVETRVDRLDRRGSGEDDTSPSYEIVDYKTTRPENQLEAGDLARECAPIVQLLAVSHATSVPVERVTWLYLRSGESVTWWPEAEDVEAATDRLLTTVRKMQADVDFAPAPGEQCGHCPFARDCPALSGGVGVNPAATGAEVAAELADEIDEAA